MNKAMILNPTRPIWPGFSSPKSITGDANCMEKLVLHCANAIESNDATLAQQIIWVLNNLASPEGDSTQRLTTSFLRALISRAASMSPSFSFLSLAAASFSQKTLHRFSVIELAAFVDLTPWHRFGFIAANAAILKAIQGYSSVHIVDLSLTHCMQLPTLIDSMATKLHKQQFLKLTVVLDSTQSPPPPLLGVSYEELGSKLVHFAASRSIPMEFRIISSSYSDGLSSLIEQLRLDPYVYNEALVINCHMMLHYIPEEETLTSTFLRSVFLKEVRDLNPTIVTLIDEDADFTSSNLISRLQSLFNYMWIPYDTVDTFLTRGSDQRVWYEADIGWKIDNVVAKEGFERVERLEPMSRWLERMREAKFTGIGFGEAAATEAKAMLEEHAAGWGMKIDVCDDDDVDRFVLTWKGHSVVFASAWVPVNELCDNNLI